jgi:RNA polymerase sigma factor (sigma-70 family)
VQTLSASCQGTGGATDEVGARPETDHAELSDQTAEPSDQELVLTAQDGSTEAFEALYRRHAPAAWRVAQAVTRNPDDASDAVAEAFTRVFKALPSRRLGAGVAFRPYLLAAVRNAAIDGLRKSGRLRPTDEMDNLDGHAVGAGPSERLMVGDDRLKMAEAFAALPERWRSVLWMTEVEEMPARDVAKLLGLTANGVAQLAVRARAGLRDRYLQAHVRNHARPTCVHTVEHLGAYVGGGLAPRDIAKVDQHLAGCADCRNRLVEVEDFGSTLRRIAMPIPAGLGALALKHFRLGGLSAAVDAPRRVLPAAAAGGLRRAVAAAAGASALVISLGGVAFLGPVEPATTPVMPAVEASPSPANVAEAAPATRPAPASAPAATAQSSAQAAGATTAVTDALPALPLPSLPPVNVPLPPIPLPVEATAGVGVGGVGAAVGVGQCTGVVVGPVTAGCPPAAPNGTAGLVNVPGVIDLKVL